MDGSPHSTLRLFVAISLPEEVKAELIKTQRTLRKQCEESALRWTPPEQLHLTLKFLGAVDESQLGALTQALAGAAASSGRLRLRAEGLGFFPAGGPPRVVWAGVRDGGSRLEGMQRAIETASAPFTRQEPEGRFTGHVTLARVKTLNRAAGQRLKEAAAKLERTCFGEWDCAEIELMRSELSATGARHSCLARLGMA